MKPFIRLYMVLPVGLFVLLSLFFPGCSDNSLDSYTFEPKPDVMIIEDIDYYPNKFFDLGRLPIFRSRSDTLPEPDKYDFMPGGDSIVQVFVYIDDMNPEPAVRLYRDIAHVYIDPNDTLSDDPTGEYRVSAYVEKLDVTQYYVEPNNFYIIFLQQIIGDLDLIAVYMEVKRADGSIDTIGDISSTPLKLKLIKPSNYTSVNHHVWEYQWKNVYWLGEYNIDLSKIDIDIYKGSAINNETINPDDLDNQEGVSYLRILGLDQADNFGYGGPDGEIDRAIYIDAALGLLIFPTRHPFDSFISFFIDPGSHQAVFLDDSVPEIYLSRQDQIQSASKYYIAISRPK